jgi:hypothetical protein
VQLPNVKVIGLEQAQTVFDVRGQLLATKNMSGIEMLSGCVNIATTLGREIKFAAAMSDRFANVIFARSVIGRRINVVDSAVEQRVQHARGVWRIEMSQFHRAESEHGYRGNIFSEISFFHILPLRCNPNPSRLMDV